MFSDADIVTALTVAQTGGIRGAAKKLHKSQPAVSHAIKRLEDKLGFEVFDRSQYRIVPSEQGQDFLQRCEGLLSIDTQLQGYVEAIRKGQESNLHIAVWPMFDSIRLMRVLALLNDSFPHATVQISYIESLGSAVKLLEHEVALAVYPGHFALHNEQLEVRVVDQINFVNVISPQLLAQKAEHQGLREYLLQVNRVVMQDSVSGKSYGMGIHEGGKHWIVNDQRALSAIIYQGLAWGVLPEPVVRDSLANGELVQLDFPEFGSDAAVDIVISRLKTQTLGPVANACWQAFVEM